MDFCLQALVCVNSKQTKMPERVHFSSLRPKEKKKEKGKKMTKIQPETHQLTTTCELPTKTSF